MPPGYHANTTCAKIRGWRNLKAGNLKLDSDISHGLWTRMAEQLQGVSKQATTQPHQLNCRHWGHINFKLRYNRDWQDLTQLDLEDSSPVFIAFNLKNIPSALLSQWAQQTKYTCTSRCSYWTVTLACGKATLRVASFAIKVSEALRHPRSSELWPSVWLLKDSRTLSLFPLLQVWVYGSWSHSGGSLMLQPKPIHRAKDPRNSD